MTGEIKLMGGKEKMARMLDSLFNVPSKMHGHAQSDISGMIGQYAHGNEPSHHLIYEYDYVGQPWNCLLYTSPFQWAVLTSAGNMDPIS